MSVMFGRVLYTKLFSPSADIKRKNCRESLAELKEAMFSLCTVFGSGEERMDHFFKNKRKLSVQGPVN